MESVLSDPRANRSLALLEPATRATVAPRLEPVPLVLRQNLYEEDGPMTHVWFPAVGMLSMLAATPRSPQWVATRTAS